jgi:hypothetical protein
VTLIAVFFLLLFGLVIGYLLGRHDEQGRK